MKTGTKVLIAVGALAVAGVVFYFVNQHYGWIGKDKIEPKSGASGCGCGK